MNVQINLSVQSMLTVKTFLVLTNVSASQAITEMANTAMVRYLFKFCFMIIFRDFWPLCDFLKKCPKID